MPPPFTTKGIQPQVPYRFYRMLCAGFFLVLLSACSTAPVSLDSATASNVFVSPDLVILNLKPRLSFERIHNEAKISGADYKSDVLAAGISKIAQQAISNSQIRTTECTTENQTEIVQLCSKLHINSVKLSQGLISKESGKFLKNLSSLDKNHAVLAHFLRVKVGPGGYWDPNSGAIGSNMSTSLLQTALIHSATGKVLWKNRVLLRQIPTEDDEQFTESLKLLYKDFPKKKVSKI